MNSVFGIRTLPPSRIENVDPNSTVLMNTKQTPLEKHKKYLSAYKPNDFFWGVGIENETYLEVSGKFYAKGSFFLENQSTERYSVNYFKNYNHIIYILFRFF